jgi:hypothetical protein
VLLVHDHQPERAKGDALLDERVRPHDDAGRAVGERSRGAAALRRGQAAGQQRDFDAQRAQQLGHPARVLLGEDLRGCHEHGLVAPLEGEQHGEERHHRLARADVSLEQPAHTPG